MAGSDDIDELRERAQLLEQIAKLERDAQWADLDELRERARLLKVMPVEK